MVTSRSMYAQVLSNPLDSKLIDLQELLMTGGLMRSKFAREAFSEGFKDAGFSRIFQDLVFRSTVSFRGFEACYMLIQRQ